MLIKKKHNDIDENVICGRIFKFIFEFQPMLFFESAENNFVTHTHFKNFPYYNRYLQFLKCYSKSDSFY